VLETAKLRVRAWPKKPASIFTHPHGYPHFSYI
jgi:hypothetical protein